MHMLPLLVDCYFSSLLQTGGFWAIIRPSYLADSRLVNVAGALSFDAFALFANNAGVPMTALGIGADGIAHLYCQLGGEPTGEPTPNT
jgi:hypothetical protein